ncbi:tRNA-dihydrouridine synthase family protein [Companilactobacillus suantsaicola]|uniref:tRNA-dihydrouridine synthase n=1 Tax=Companilactobacillus suantsaicola TaxID=2487723 RepID=A0A4Z0JQQ8_9LACO|nr:tRNA-dihydrouridine synthase family protein [Companilactobacillus suantsaicola]TGD24474.1 tRNA-dihydrouridine synthase family protein [Companilactobacillus suantsaicola]
MTESNFWSDIAQTAKAQNRPFFTMAPMEAVSNTVFRQVVAKAYAPDAFFSEFVYAKSITDPNTKFPVDGRLYIDPRETKKPVVQLWGDSPIDYQTGTNFLKEQGFKAVDINTGCPDKTVIKNHGGTYLISNPEKVDDLVAACKQSNLAVSIKTRLGYSKVSEYHNWIPKLLSQHVDLLTVHLRTKMEMSKVPAHFEVIDDLIKLRNEIAPETLLQVNGDILNYQAGVTLAKEHPGLDGIMIGRGVFTTPFAFEPGNKPHSLDELLNLLRLQLDLFDDFSTHYDTPRFVSLKRFFKIYARDELGATDLRNKLVRANNSQEVRQILDDFQN